MSDSKEIHITFCFTEKASESRILQNVLLNVVRRHDSANIFVFYFMYTKQQSSGLPFLAQIPREMFSGKSYLHLQFCLYMLADGLF